MSGAEMAPEQIPVAPYVVDHETPDEPELKAPEGGAAEAPPFRPTGPDVARQKAAAGQAPAGPKGDTPTSPDQLHAIGATFNGMEGLNSNETGGWRPPDTHGAQGSCRYMEITNAALRIYNTCTSPISVVATKSLATFFGYTTQSLFDPRVVYDRAWNRWVVTAIARSESATVQLFFTAFSTTADPNGAYRIYRTDQGGSGATENFFDYAQLGMDQDSVMFTANMFPNSGAAATARFICVAKAKVYNGAGAVFSTWNGLLTTLAPPIVLDGANSAVLAAANNGTHISLYRATACGRTSPTLSGPVHVDVPDYTAPPDATQPGTTKKLDTLDRRFVNASTQYGSSLWQVHTIALGNLAAPKFYELNIATNTVKQQGFFWRASFSHDFNASIAASANGTACVTWSSSDSTVFAHVRASCRHNGTVNGVAADPLGTMNLPGITVSGGTSPTFYNASADATQRWGDYSAVVMDQSNANRAWVVNEKILSNTVWGSRIGLIGY